jgi:hypothetical protein
VTSDSRTLPTPADPSNGSSRREPLDDEPDHRGLRRLVQEAVKLGPFAFVLGSYGILADYLPEDWFGEAWVLHAFAVTCAIVVGLVGWRITQIRAIRRLAGDVTVTRSPRAPVPRRPSDPMPSVHEILEGARRQLVEDCHDGRAGDTSILGWAQFFGDDRGPGAVGTSYGIRLMLALEVSDARIDRRRLVDTLLALQRAGGGWSGRSQRDVARPEVTSWVLQAAVRLGLEPTVRSALVTKLVEITEPGRDRVGMEHTTVLTAAIATLAEVEPGSPRLAQLLRTLVDTAVVADDGRERVAAWPEWPRRGSSPSTAHTARAVVALHRAANAISPETNAELRLQHMSDAGVRWLVRHADLDPVDERLRRGDRRVSIDVDELIVLHFTAAWVTRALLCISTPLDGPTHELLHRAVQHVVSAQRDGVWRWRDSEPRPVWMTYQGVQALRAYALRNMAWPP